MTGLSAISYQLSVVRAASPPGRLAASTPVTRAAALGVVAGMRSQLPLALLALAVQRRRSAMRSSSSVDFLHVPVVRAALGIAAIGELIVDKLPFVPNRNEPGPLAGRIAFGGIAGAVFALETGAAIPGRALVGATAAGLGTLGAYHLRATVDRVTGLPDPLVGAAEDLLALALGLWAVRGD